MTPDVAAEASAGGAVAVAGRAFPVTPLSAAGERGLRAELRAIAVERDGPGGLFARLAPRLDWLMKHAPAHYPAAVDAIIDRENRGGDPDMTGAYQSPAGVAVQLFHRSRAAVPGLTLDEVRAVVTAANAADVLAAMEEAVTAANKSPAAGAAG